MKTYLFIINGLGVGDLPDCSAYNKRGYNTVAELLGNVTLPSFSLLGLSSVSGASDSEEVADVIATYARGRMLTNRVGFEHGITEILGNVFHYDGDEERVVAEDIISRLHNSDVISHAIGSGLNHKSDYTLPSDIGVMEQITCIDDSVHNYESRNDDDVMDYIANIDDKDALIIAEFNDFASSVLIGDRDKALAAIINLDSWMGVMMDAIDNDDLLIVTGNHGVSIEDRIITREYVPIMIFNRKCPIPRSLSTQQGLNVIAYTIADAMDVYKNNKAMMCPRIVSSHSVDISLAKIKSIVAVTMQDRKRNVADALTKVKGGIKSIVDKIDNRKDNKV